MCLIYFAGAVPFFVLAWLIIGSFHGNVLMAVGLLMVLLGSALHHLTVVDLGESLAVRFGPLPLFRRTIKYANMQKVEAGRTHFREGLCIGIHHSTRRGWLWNLWGRSCVIVRLKDGSVLRIGTNDTFKLVRFLEGKIDDYHPSRPLPPPQE